MSTSAVVTTSTSVSPIRWMLTCKLLVRGRVAHLDVPLRDDAGGDGVGDKDVVRQPQGRAQVALQLALWKRVDLTGVIACKTNHK